MSPREEGSRVCPCDANPIHSAEQLEQPPGRLLIRLEAPTRLRG